MKPTKVLLTLLALSSSSFAQDTSPKLRIAREVISAMQSDKMFEGVAAQMKQMAIVAKSPAADTPEQRKKDEVLQGKIMDLSLNFAKEMMSKMDQIYADVYTEAELNAMKAFFTSPEGRAMSAKQPAVMAQMMPLVQEMQRELAPKITALIKDSEAGK